MSVRDFPPFFFVLYYDIVPNRWVVRTLRRVAHGLGYRPEFERAFHMPDGLGAQDPQPVAIFSAEPILSGNGESNTLHNLANIDLSFTDMTHNLLDLASVVAALRWALSRMKELLQTGDPYRFASVEGRDLNFSLVVTDDDLAEWNGRKVK